MIFSLPGQQENEARQAPQTARSSFANSAHVIIIKETDYYGSPSSSRKIS